MTKVLIQVYFVSRQTPSTRAQDETWAISRRIGMICYYINRGNYSLGYKFENGGVVVTQFEGRQGLCLVINGKHAFTDPNNFGLLQDYNYNFTEQNYDDLLFAISEVIYNSGFLPGFQRYKRMDFNQSFEFLGQRDFKLNTLIDGEEFCNKVYTEAKFSDVQNFNNVGIEVETYDNKTSNSRVSTSYFNLRIVNEYGKTVAEKKRIIENFSVPTYQKRSYHLSKTDSELGPHMNGNNILQLIAISDAPYAKIYVKSGEFRFY